jgi:hypothetical protein
MRLENNHAAAAVQFIGPKLLLPVLISCALACSIAKPVDSRKPPLGDYQYTSYDDKGDKVVEGRISITSSELKRIQSGEVTQLKGNWELKKVGKQQPIGDQNGKGDLIGSIDKSGEIYLDLNPNLNDANVVLRGKLEGKRFHGTWSFIGHAGPVIKGTFEAIRQ